MSLVTLDEPGGGQPLFVDFVNTLHWYEGAPIELLGTEAELAGWLAERRLPTDGLSGCLPALHALREHARAATEALALGQMPSVGDLEAVNAALRSPTGRLVLADAEGPRPQLALEMDASNGVLIAFRIALSFATFLESGERSRLKLCANPGCGFAFVDTSTNGTRRWCYMRYCGNRLKVRAFRLRRSETPERSGRPTGVGKVAG